MARLIPQARMVELPEEVGEGGDVSDFLVRLGRSEEDFRRLLALAQPLPPEALPELESRSVPMNEFRQEIEDLKRGMRIENVAGRYLELCPSGARYVARCPFHEDQHPSFTVYPESQSFYCFGCEAYGDVITLLMRIEHLTFPEAIALLRTLTLPAA